MAASPPLGTSVGYGIVLGLGFLFAFGMILTTWILKRYQNEVQTSEMFSTAGRTVKSGLVASAVVSSWTWAATLLQSSGVAYRYGVSGPFWYASGATVQILLFATLAIALKQKAPNAHTFLEAIRARYGMYGHLVFMVFGLMTNILVTAMLLTGGSAVVTALTGVPTAAACFLLPIGVVLYTIFGGIKATYVDSCLPHFVTEKKFLCIRFKVSDGLCPYGHDFDYPPDFCIYGLRHQCQLGQPGKGLRSSRGGRQSSSCGGQCWRQLLDHEVERRSHLLCH